MPKADATELAPKKSAHHSPPAPNEMEHGRAVPPALQPVSRRLAVSNFENDKEHFFGKLGAEALGHKTRRSPGCFCRAFRMGFSLGSRRDTRRAYTPEYPIPRRCAFEGRSQI